MRRKEERSNQGQTNNKAKQHSTPEDVTFPKKNELLWVGLEPTTLYTLDIVHVKYRTVHVGIYMCPGAKVRVIARNYAKLRRDYA